MSRGYTQAALIADAKRAGFAVTGTTIERWVTLGLLDRAAGRGRGRGRGVEWRWPETQRDLLLVLLRNRAKTRSLDALFNIPVTAWLYWGEDLVPCPQLRRAMESWVRRTGDRRAFRSRAWASAFVRSLAMNTAAPTLRSILIEELTAWAESGEVDHAEVLHRFEEVVGPDNPTAQTDGSRAYGLARAQLVVARKYADLLDAHFLWARAFYLYAQASYAAEHVRLGADQRFGKLAPAVRLRACCEPCLPRSEPRPRNGPRRRPDGRGNPRVAAA